MSGSKESRADVVSAELTPMPLAETWPPWPDGLTAENWPAMRQDIRRRFLSILGPFPDVLPAPQVQTLEQHDDGRYRRMKISFNVEVDDRSYAWLLIPKSIRGKRAGVLAMHCSTRGTGKDRIVNLRGYKPEDPPAPDYAYAIRLVEAGCVVVAPDVWGDGNRISRETGIARDTRPFYQKHPEWSYSGKIIWDTMRTLDVLCSLPEVDASRIGITGHSLGGNVAVHTAAFDDRIAAIVSSGCTAAWYEKHQPDGWACDDSKGEINCSVRRLRPYLTEDKWRTIPVHWPEILSLAAPRPFLCIQAGVAPHDDMEGHWRHYGSNHAGCRQIYRMLGAEDRVSFMKTGLGHAFPPYAQAAMVEWFNRYLNTKVL